MVRTNTASPISSDASNKVINDRINKLRKQMISTDDEIQEIMVLGLTHSTGIGNFDVSWAGRLVNALPQTYRRALVKNYLHNNTMIRFTAAKERGQFKASVKSDEDLVKFNAERAKMVSETMPKGLPPMTWDVAKAYVMDKYPDDYGTREGEDAAFAGKFKSPFYNEPEVAREPELYTSKAAEGELRRLIDKLDRQAKADKGVDPIDVPALRGLMLALKRVDDDFKLGKIKGVNDDNKLIDIAPMNRSTPIDEPVTRTGTDG